MDLAGNAQTWELPANQDSFSVLPVSRCLQKNLNQDGHPRAIYGLSRRIRVVEIKRGPKKTRVLLFYGCTNRLKWDPVRLEWRDATKPTAFMRYSSKLGRELLKK